MKYFLALALAVFVASCANQNQLGYQGTGGNLPYQGTNYGTSNGGYGTGAEVNEPASEVSAPDLQANFGNTVLFPEDQSFLTAAAKATLDSQALWLSRNNVNVLIEGHADEQGTREYNLALGAKRAAAVRDYLAIKGVPSSRMDVITYGKERPLATCSEESCWSKNRRAVTVVR